MNTATAAPVTGWTVVNPSSGLLSTKPLSGALTDSPVLGNGSEDSAAVVAMYADISGTLNGAADVSLANGQRVTLSGSAALSGIVSSMEQFRFGLFNESTSPIDAFDWRGFIASNSAEAGGGALRAKFEDGTTFAQTGSAFTLLSVRDGDDFLDETYHFSMTLSRFNDEARLDASLTTAEGWSQVWPNLVAPVFPPDGFDFNRVGFLAGSGMHANRISFSSIDVTVSQIEALTLQVTTTGPNAGAVQIRNNLPTDVEIEYYEITSSAGSLNLANWNSLDAQENGDPELEGWEEAAGTGSGILSEYSLFSTTNVLAGTSLTLGRAFVPSGEEDLNFLVGLADGSLVRGIIEYVPEGLTGDYNDDGTIDAADYVVWRRAAGTNIALPNDPFGGTIGADQYDRWRANFGQSAGFGSSGTAVPEPSTLGLFLLATLTWVGAVRRLGCHQQ